MKTVVTRALLLLILSASALCQSQECATISRHGDSVTLTVNSYRPLDAIANTLAQQFGIIISAEDPQHQSAAHQQQLEINFSVAPDSSTSRVPALLEQVVREATDQLPVAYRLHHDGEFYAFVPTTRDAHGADSALSILDLKVTIPPGTRTIVESAQIMVDSLSTQTGLQVSCCQMFVAGIPWGQSTTFFEANNEPARQVLERLIRLDQQASTVSPRRYWLLRCDSRWCFIDVHPVWANACR